jgi:hypothetical protein
LIHVLRETHEPPKDIAEILRVGGGVNPYGEPNYRVVWGQSRMDWIGGKWQDFDDNGNLLREAIEVRYVPKYCVNRWIIERWVPAETYGPPALWEMQTFETVDGRIVPALGPYPSRGDYELVFTLEDNRGEFVQLDPMIARAFVACLEYSRQESTETLTEKKSKRQDKDDREYDSFADSVLHDGSTITGPMVSVP